MLKKKYTGPERRKFVRLNYTTPMNCKVCKKQTVSNLLKGYTANVSEIGLLCNIREKVKRNDILWLSFDRGTLSFCEDIEKKSFIYQNGVIAKVARVSCKSDGTYDVGVCFITREERNVTNIYPKIHFGDDHSVSEHADTIMEEDDVSLETESQTETEAEEERDNEN
jgi:hypothetical protein